MMNICYDLCIEYLLWPMYWIAAMTYVLNICYDLCIEYLLWPMYWISAMTYVLNICYDLCIEYLLWPMYWIAAMTYVLNICYDLCIEYLLWPMYWISALSIMGRCILHVFCTLIYVSFIITHFRNDGCKTCFPKISLFYAPPPSLALHCGCVE